MSETIRNRLDRLERALGARVAQPAPTITGEMTPKEAAAAYAATIRQGVPGGRRVDLTPAQRAEAARAYEEGLE